VAEVTPAREALEAALCEGIGKAWRMYGAYLASDRSGTGVPLEYPEVREEAEKALAAAEAWAADEVAKVADVTLARARRAEDELFALEGRLASSIDAALKVERERAVRAEAEAARLRDLLADRDRDGDEYLTPGDAARRLRVHPRTLIALEKAGDLEVSRTPGRHRRFLTASVEELRQKRKAGKA
jgi:excisionase family DNA binding protein